MCGARRKGRTVAPPAAVALVALLSSLHEGVGLTETGVSAALFVSGVVTEKARNARKAHHTTR